MLAEAVQGAVATSHIVFSQQWFVAPSPSPPLWRRCGYLPQRHRENNIKFTLCVSVSLCLCGSVSLCLCGYFYQAPLALKRKIMASEIALPH